MITFVILCCKYGFSLVIVTFNSTFFIYIINYYTYQVAPFEFQSTKWGVVTQRLEKKHASTYSLALPSPSLNLCQGDNVFTAGYLSLDMWFAESDDTTV